jgi:hypothetical protein|tara:strand:+ start:322 stop:747 length:426 start_codon:yes stop_codon:yes gene_type:complete
MIKYILKCKNKHEFESWFLNSVEFERLKEKKLIKCIFCKSQNVEKSIMSPGILGSSKKEDKNFLTNEEFIKVKKDLLRIRKFVEKNFEFVGDRFPQEVRNVYYDKKEKKNIYGNATTEERDELREEGIDLTTVPWISDKEN